MSEDLSWRKYRQRCGKCVEWKSGREILVSTQPNALFVFACHKIALETFVLINHLVLVIDPIPKTFIFSPLSLIL